jgi:predicted Zn-dependent protease
MSGQTERAISSFETALSLAPGSALNMTNLGLAYLEHGDTDKGIALLSRSLEIDPRQPQVRSLLKRHRSR